MSRVRNLLAVALAISATTGCCSFYDRWCGPRNRNPAPCYAPPACCCLPANTGYCAPVAATTLPPTAVPNYGVPAGYAPTADR